MIVGDPDVVDAAAALSGTTGFSDVAAGVDAAAAAALTGWEGEAAAAAGAAFARFRPALAAADEACRALAPALRAYAAELRAAQEQAADTLTADAAAERLRLADEQTARAIDRAREHLAAMRAATPTTASAPAPAERPDETDEPGLLSTLGHTALDVVGLVPIVGEAADVANAAWYGAEGDYVAAGLSLAAAIPLAGWVFTGGKLGVKGVDTIKAVTDAGGAAAWVKGRPSMVPWNAERVPYKGVGEAYRWTDRADGKAVRYHAHPASANAPAGSNSAAGPTYRLQVGNHHLDVAGERYTAKQLDARSSAYSEQAANATHIPYPSNQPVGWDSGQRAFVPNPASLTDGTGDPSRDAR